MFVAYSNKSVSISSFQFVYLSKENLVFSISAENVAKKYGLSRLEQDEFSFESQSKTKAAIDEGHFDEEIVTVSVTGRKGPTLVSKDEHPRPETTLEGLSKLRPAFDKQGTVTAGNASGNLTYNNLKYKITL